MKVCLCFYPTSLQNKKSQVLFLKKKKTPKKMRHSYDFHLLEQSVTRVIVASPHTGLSWLFSAGPLALYYKFQLKFRNLQTFYIQLVNISEKSQGYYSFNDIFLIVLHSRVSIWVQKKGVELQGSILLGILHNPGHTPGNVWGGCKMLMWTSSSMWTPVWKELI